MTDLIPQTPSERKKKKGWRKKKKQHEPEYSVQVAYCLSFLEYSNVLKSQPMYYSKSVLSVSKPQHSHHSFRPSTLINKPGAFFPLLSPIHQVMQSQPMTRRWWVKESSHYLPPPPPKIHSAKFYRASHCAHLNLMALLQCAPSDISRYDTRSCTHQCKCLRLMREEKWLPLWFSVLPAKAATLKTYRSTTHVITGKGK